MFIRKTGAGPQVEIAGVGKVSLEEAEKLIGKDVRWSRGKSGSKTPSEIARSWQGTGKYPGIDDYVDVIVEKGTVLYRGEPNGTEYFTTLDAIEQSGRDAMKLFEGLPQYYVPDVQDLIDKGILIPVDNIKLNK